MQRINIVTSWYQQMIDSNKYLERFKYRDFIIVLYATFALTSIPLGYKLVHFGPFIFSGAGFLVPLRSITGDIIAEVYGYKAARRQIINIIFAAFLFSAISFLVIRLPSPSYWKHQSAFDFILGRSIYAVPMAVIGLLIGANINMYIVSYFRVLCRGRYFFIRSIGASVCGELTQYIIVLTLLYASVLPFKSLVKLIVFNYALQIVYILVAAVPASIAVKFLKRTEKIDLSSEVVKLNPFK